MKFSDIERFLTSDCHYKVDIDWEYLQNSIDRYADCEDIEGASFNMIPDFQRGHVWTEQQQIDFVEYALQGGESGMDIYWNHPNWMGSFKGEMTLVDGLQRVTAALAFMDNKIKAFGLYRNEFEGNTRSLTVRFRFSINSLKSRADLLKWYLQMNTGGVVHTDFEIARVQRMLDEEEKK